MDYLRELSFIIIKLNLIFLRKLSGKQEKGSPSLSSSLYNLRDPETPKIELDLADKATERL